MHSRFICLLAFCLLAAQHASAQTVDVSILIDDPVTAGCDVTPTGLPLISGIDARLTATVDQLAAQVTNVDLALCTGYLLA